MTEEREEALLDAHRAALTRYAYFLLAVAVVATGYALNQTRYNELTPSEVPLAIAVLAWALSFYAGCMHVECHFTALRLNALHLRAQRGAPALFDADTQKNAASLEAAEKAFRRANSRMMLYARQQFRFLMLGALAYFAWAVWEMFMRTTSFFV